MIEKIRNINGLTEGRLHFRKLRKEDLPSLLPYFEDEDSLKFRTPTDQKPQEMAEEWHKAIQIRYQNDWDGLYITELDHSKEIVGLIGILRQTVDDEHLYEIGYHVLPNYRKRHIASEGAQILSRFMKEHKVGSKVVSIIHPENVASKKVAKNNNMSLWKTTIFRDGLVEVWRKYL